MRFGTNVKAPKDKHTEAIEDWPSVVHPDNPFPQNVKNVIEFFHRTFTPRFKIKFTVGAISDRKCFWWDSAAPEPSRKRQRIEDDDSSSSTVIPSTASDPASNEAKVINGI
ncbi:hypothetical protein HDU96_004607 [Phlyctochytrium bullatum]|nr:hypothetical protein HDU96_004607 [Phlyctochytrium bullatum]